MYAKNENAQAIESRNRVRDALLRLMKKYPYKDITITQICQEAQIVRQTYYRNFDVKDDILEYHLDRMFQEYFVSYYEQGDVRIQLENFFEYMLQCREYLELSEKNDLFFMLNKAITLNITDFFNMSQLTTITEPGFEPYIKSFIASSICSLLSIWVQNGFSESPKVLARLSQRLLSGLSVPV